MTRSASRQVLEALNSADKWTLGLTLIHAGAMRRGVGYVYLSELEDAGYVRSRQWQDDPVRREWQITSAGRAALLRDDL